MNVVQKLLLTSVSRSCISFETGVLWKLTSFVLNRVGEEQVCQALIERRRKEGTSQEMDEIDLRFALGEPD